MTRNILNARIRDQANAAQRLRNTPPVTKKNKLRADRLHETHNLRIRQWRMLKNISKNLIRHVRPRANVTNAGIQQALNYFLIPVRSGNFNSVNIKRNIKNQMPSYGNSRGTRPGSGTEYYNKNGRRYNH